MLYLMRKQDESIIINNDIELKVIEIKGKTVKLGFHFPKGSSVLRKELYDKIVQENLESATSEEEKEELRKKPQLRLGKQPESDSAE